MTNGNIFVTATVKGDKTLVYEFNPRTQDRVWGKTFNISDTHDTDLINNGTAILVANMRNYNESANQNDDRLFIYNRTTDRIEWEWRFDDYYDPPKERANYTGDWTHVNDVDKIGKGRYLASPRSFDQIIIVNRTTGKTTTRLGSDGETDVLNSQHNPDYLESENGTSTLLVGASENDRIVEYAKFGSNWTRTWTLKGDLSWPRDADRLPNGNTLITDSANHRVVEVTPQGKVVWEFYAPWLVYDAVRVPTDEHGGPTNQDLNTTGTFRIRGGADLHKNKTALQSCHQTLQNITGWADSAPSTTGRRTSLRAVDNESTANNVIQNNGGNGSDSNADSPTDPVSVAGLNSLSALLGVLLALLLAMYQN